MIIPASFVTAIGTRQNYYGDAAGAWSEMRSAATSAGDGGGNLYARAYRVATAPPSYKAQASQLFAAFDLAAIGGDTVVSARVTALVSAVYPGSDYSVEVSHAFPHSVAGGPQNWTPIAPFSPLRYQDGGVWLYTQYLPEPHYSIRSSLFSAGNRVNLAAGPALVAQIESNRVLEIPLTVAAWLSYFQDGARMPGTEFEGVQLAALQLEVVTAVGAPPSGRPLLSDERSFLLTATIAPPEENVAPAALDTKIVVGAATLRLEYTYYDANGDDERTDLRQVRWMRNDAPQPAYDDMIEIAPPRVIGDRWRAEVAVHDGFVLSESASTPEAWIGDAWSVEVSFDAGRRVQRFNVVNATTRGSRRTLRLPLKAPMRGWGCRVKIRATAATKLHGFKISYVTSAGTPR